MNPKKITGMISVTDNHALNARLDYEIDLATNRVRYILRTEWKPLGRLRTRPIFGEVTFGDYKEAYGIYEALALVAEEELKKAKEVAA